MGYIEIPEVWK